MLVILIAVTFGAVFYINQRLTEDLNNLKSTISQKQEENKELQNLEKEISIFQKKDDLIKNLQNSKINWYLVVKEIINLKPTSITITALNLDSNLDNQKFSLTGTTPSRKTLTYFQNNLEDSSYFKNVDFESSTLIKPENPNSNSDFSLTFYFQKEGK